MSAPPESSTRSTYAPESQRGDTLINALIGAVVAVVTSFTGFGPLLGGVVAGYLQQTDVRDGAIVGGLSGLFVAIPIFGLLFLFLPVVGFFHAGIAVAGFLVILFIFVFIALYSVALGAVGGAIGAYLFREEYDRKVANPR